MTKYIVKILSILCLTGQLVLGQILVPVEKKIPVDPVDPLPIESCKQRLVCQSNNDPHMVNFWNQPFEYQYQVKDQCLHQTKYVQVSASFNICPSPYQGARCNCAVKITLYNGEQAFIDNCGSPVFATYLLSFSSSPSVTCQTVTNPLFDPLDESDWAVLPVTSGNPSFLCAIVNGITYIKTRLPWPNNNVIVQVFPGMSSLHVHASKSYTANPTINQKCLCEYKKDFLIELQENLVREMPENINNCKKTLLNECFMNLLQFENALTIKRIEEIEKLIANCALDLKESRGEGKVGLFQQNEIQDQINTAVLEAFHDPNLEKILMEYCACQLRINPENVDICKRLNIKF